MCANKKGHYSHNIKGGDPYWYGRILPVALLLRGLRMSVRSYHMPYLELILDWLKWMAEKKLNCIHWAWALCICPHVPSSSIQASLPPSSLSCSMPPLHWDWYNIFHPQLAESLLTNSNCFCTWELGAEAGKTEWGGGEGVAGNTEDRGFGQTAGLGFCPGLLSALLYHAEKQ